MEINSQPAALHPQVCTCSYCRQHSARYIFDPKGSLTLYLSKVRYYKLSQLPWRFMICDNCGTLIGCELELEKLFFAVNKNILQCGEFGSDVRNTQHYSDKRAEDYCRKHWFKKIKIVDMAQIEKLNYTEY